MNLKDKVISTILIIFVFIPVSLFCEKKKPILFPNLYKSKPDITSPYKIETSGDPSYTEYITIRMPTGYAVIDVTQENGNIYSCMHKLHGKGKQLYVAERDFRSLGKTGLHSEEELNKKIYITGRKIDFINYIARPGRLSYSGFIGKDEDIISVLKKDNRIVKKMRLKHRYLAKPLFHIWNIIFGNYIKGRYAQDITIFYNGLEVILYAEGGKGYQESIFHDEIEGRWNISLRRDLTKEETLILKKSYPDFTKDQMSALILKLTSINISEMNPFYIQRYGFYQGNTPYRADPIAISLIFGLRTIKDIVKTFGKTLYTNLFPN